MTEKPDNSPARGPSADSGHRARVLFRLSLLVLFAALIVVFSVDLLHEWERMLMDMIGHARQSRRAIVVGGLVYALCLAVPFVPGVELGVLLMVVFGKTGIVMAYIGTLVGLNLAFGVGWLLRHKWRESFPGWRVLADDFGRFGQVSLGRTRLGRGLARWAGSKRQLRDYLLVGILFNLPGNALIGGGGGIALVGGLSGRLSWGGFVLTVMLATAAVPLLAWFGVLELARFLPEVG